MSYAIIAFNIAALAGLLVTVVLGYGLGAEIAARTGHAALVDPNGSAQAAAEAAAAVAAGFRRHFLLALSSTLVGLFGQSMIFFYFIGTGISIKKAVALHGLDRRVLGKVREFKQRTSGLATLALLFLMTAFVLGGGVAARALPAWAHHFAALAAVLTHAISTWRATGAIFENMRLLDELDRRVLGMSARGKVEAQRTAV